MPNTLAVQQSQTEEYEAVNAADTAAQTARDTARSSDARAIVEAIESLRQEMRATRIATTRNAEDLVEQVARLVDEVEK